MPIQYVLLDHGNFVYARAYDNLTAEDLVHHESALLRDPGLAPGYRQLLDCRWAGDDQVDESALAPMAEVHCANLTMVKGARYAVVAHSLAWFQIGAQYRCEDYGMTMIIFNDPSTACIWLGVDYGQLSEYRRSRIPLYSSGRGMPVAVPAV